MLESYAYDANGNRVPDARPTTRRRPQTGARYTFDAAGFLVTRGADTFNYATGANCCTATAGGKTVTYEYDSAAAAHRADPGRARTEFLYGDPKRPFLVTGSRAGGQLTTYYYDTDDRLFALERGGQRYYVGTDQVGHAARDHRRRRHRRQDARLRQLRRAQPRGARPARSRSRSASRAGSRTR